MLVALMVLASACIDFTAPLQREGRPTTLQFSRGGFGAFSRSLQLRGDTVVAWRMPPDYLPGRRIDSVRVVPSAEAWRAFWIAADNAGVRRWHTQYMAEGIVDGEGWSISLVSDGREITSSGSNAYPDARGREHELEVTAEFQSFATAMNVLAGVSNWF